MGKTLVLAAILALVAAPANAQTETWLSASVASYHFEEAKEHYNQSNPGLGIEWGTENARVVAGFYRNSIERQSRALGGALLTDSFLGGFRVGLAAGGVTGYEKSVTAFVLPILAFERGQFGANLALIPPVKEKVGGAIGLQIKLKFGGGS